MWLRSRNKVSGMNDIFGSGMGSSVNKGGVFGFVSFIGGFVDFQVNIKNID